MPTALSVNVNKVALLRNSRHLDIPNVCRAAKLCLQAGAAGITIHPRPDERHIKTHDVADLHQLLQAWPDKEFNIEGNPFHNLMPLVERYRPHQVTFVPDAQNQFTSDHGWDLLGSRASEICDQLRPLIAQAKAWGVRVSLFMNPEPQAMQLACELGADRVELYTEAYARAHGTAQQDAVTAQYAWAAQAAAEAGLGVNAGHDLNRDNLAAFVKACPQVLEVSIGHALVADALELGYSETVKAYLGCLPRS